MYAVWSFSEVMKLKSIYERKKESVNRRQELKNLQNRLISLRISRQVEPSPSEIVVKVKVESRSMDPAPGLI